MSKTVDSKTSDSKDAAAAQHKREWQAYIEDFRRAGDFAHAQAPYALGGISNGEV